MLPIERFLQYLQFEKRYSGHTLGAYKNDLDQFSVWINTVYSLEPLQADHSLVRSWIVELMNEGISATSVNRKISSLRSFYRFMLKEGLVPSNPMIKVKGPKMAKRLPVFVEESKMTGLLDDNELFSDTPGAKRNLLILELFYNTGIRLSELIGLKRKDVDVYNLTIKVLGKRNKERIIPISAHLAGRLREYIAETEEGTAPEHLFMLPSGKKLYPKLVYRIVNSYLSRVTTSDKKSPHVLRHTFATHMLNGGADINAIKELLGHANLSATQIYTHNTIEKLKNIYKQAHPKA
jgi:integrase/recombinase XerC